jgi:hypothetical protein
VLEEEVVGLLRVLYEIPHAFQVIDLSLMKLLHIVPLMLREEEKEEVEVMVLQFLYHFVARCHPFLRQMASMLLFFRLFLPGSQKESLYWEIKRQSLDVDLEKYKGHMS